MFTFEDIFATIKESESTYNRYNVKAERPEHTLPNDYVIDEEKSVKWNREQVRIHNQQIALQWKKYRDASLQGWYNFCSDLKEAISNEYGFNKNQVDYIREQFELTTDLYEVANKAKEICEFLTDFLSREDSKEVSHN